MLVAGGNMVEYNELWKVGVGDFIIRYNSYVHEIEMQKKAVEPLKTKFKSK